MAFVRDVDDLVLTDDEFGFLGGLFKKVKKAVSIKNVVKLGKKAAPIVGAVATGGITAGAILAAKKVAGAALAKGQSVQLSPSVASQFPVGTVQNINGQQAQIVAGAGGAPLAVPITRPAVPQIVNTAGQTVGQLPQHVLNAQRAGVSGKTLLIGGGVAVGALLLVLLATRR